MLYTYKIGTKHIAFDNETLKLSLMSELEWEISDFVGEDMPKTCPSALRYALAKYDSHTIDSAYARVYAMRTSADTIGKSIAFENDTVTPDASVDESAPSLSSAVSELADKGCKCISATAASNSEMLASEYEKIARELYKRARQGNKIIFTPFVITESELRAYASLSPIDKKRVECALFIQV